MGIALAPLAVAAMVGGTAVSTYGAIQQGQSQSAAANYNAQVQMKNAQQAKINSQLAAEAGNAQVESQGFKNRARIGTLKAEQGASGVTVGQDSFADVVESQRQLGQLDALTIRSNATKEAYGYLTQGESYKEKAALDKAEGANASTAGYVGGAGTLLNGLGSAGEAWNTYQMKAGLDTTGFGAPRNDFELDPG